MKRTCVVATSILVILALLMPATGRVVAHPLSGQAGVTSSFSMQLWPPFTARNDRPAIRAVDSPWLPQRTQAEPVFSEPAPPLVATRAISIPFGFNAPLILDVDQQTVAVAGPGACTAGEQVTIEVRISQEESGALAAGRTEATCTGESGGWTITARQTPGPRLAPGPARACGVATTHAGETETDRLEWCRDLMLAVAVYLPRIENGELYTRTAASSGIPI